MMNFWVDTAVFLPFRTKKVVLIKHDGLYYKIDCYCLEGDRTLVCTYKTRLRHVKTLESTHTDVGVDPRESREWISMYKYKWC